MIPFLVIKALFLGEKCECLGGLLDKGMKVPTSEGNRWGDTSKNRWQKITRVLQRTISNEGRFVSKQNMVLGI